MSFHRPRAVFNENSLCVLDIETICGEEMDDNSFPPWCLHTPVVASLLTAVRDSHGEWAFDLETVRFSDPEEALCRVDDLLRGRACISFAGRSFDLRVLMLTAQKCRLMSLPSLTAAATEPRYLSARHYDLADVISGYGAARGASLSGLCGALGIPVKQEAHGSEVGALYDRGDLEAIERYCETDVCATLLAYAYQRAMETGDPGYHASLTWQFARWAEEQYLDHLAPYAEVRDPQALQQFSLLGQLDASLENAQLDADLRDKRAVDDSFGELTHY
ncbi:hypothetical protein GCM10011515_08940 [Tsuneonella deserti]|uniref:Predicted 3'-5' exonuclease PolB-like domain-containing protein n=1 Tax=Tsuneonella deserti TaxID=2035528 RepID=A0ABQ1S5G9_9SPHN|nr:ribonuclease H-like domain-containing protein [Tsuneonella deserti]GGD91482.1 hypothetical protein GCM10011515_08940 [Tsuneonella deserti]